MNRMTPFRLAACATVCALSALGGRTDGLADLGLRPGPLWFWNNTTVEDAKIRSQLQMMKDAGYGAASILPFGGRFRPEYLSEDYFRRYETGVESAARLGMRLWIYDEYGFPSGSAGYINGDRRSRFGERYPEFTMRRLDKVERLVTAGEAVDQSVPGGELMSVVAMETNSLRRIDLTAAAASGRLHWTAPDGVWRLMFFVARFDEPIVDYLDPDAGRKFIELTHERYCKRFGSRFGTTIVGTFFDEPTLYRGKGRAWTVSYNRRFEREHGFSPTKLYPALWYDVGPSTAEERNLLFGFRSRLYANGYVRQVSDWSVSKGIHATGHQDNEEVVNPVGTSADLMYCFRHLEMPGIDKIGGNRPAEKFYKVVSSAAHNWDRRYVMSETYGAMGDIEWSQIYSIAIDQYAKGINVLIPHAVWYDDTKVAFKPELSPRHAKYRDGLPEFNEFLTRLNTWLRPGRTVCDVAVLYPIATMQAGHRFDGPLPAYEGGVGIPGLDYVEVGQMLCETLGVDFEYLHPEALLERCVVTNGTIELRNSCQFGRFHTLVIPSSPVVGLDVLKTAAAFCKGGGRLVFTGCIPQQATRTGDDAELVALVSDLLANGARRLDALRADELQAALGLRTRMFETRFKGPPLRHVHRAGANGHVWFFGNCSGERINTEVELEGASDELCSLDPHTGERSRVRSIHAEGGTRTFPLSVAPHRSVLLVGSGVQE